ncbi:MAG: C10 family peptidase [Muribaculaceae bacterium]|nr:C10 family peptidase [Muribaculaceae bacterium]
MRKQLLLGFLAAAICGHAAVINPEAALRRAVGAPEVQTMGLHQEQQPMLVYTQMVDAQPAAYLFDRGQDLGYLVVSADDEATPLLGYADRGRIDAENLPDGLKYWLKYYAAEIDALRNGAVITLSVKNDQPELMPIEPMVSTRWNQSTPYNNLCPLDGGSRSVTGCVATAMAQVMKYHNWPPKGTGSHSYTWNKTTTLSLDYSSITYDWANMLDQYDSSATEAQNNAVATLMYSCGVSVNMNYGKNESGAVSMYCGSALFNYFNYDGSLRYLSRDYFTLSDWEAEVYKSLAEGCPVLYGGQSDAGGHEFVCDGYSSDGYFHFNWGWGGMSDGYFKLTSLNPGSQGIGGAGNGAGFNFDQDIIVGIKPFAGQSEMAIELGNLSSFSVSEAAASLGSAITVSAQFINQCYSTIEFTPGIKITGPQGDVRYQKWIYTNSLELQPGYSYQSPISFGVTLPADLGEGTYTVEPAFLSGDKWYDVQTKVGCVPSVTMKVDGSTASFTSPNAANPVIDNISFVNPKFYAGMSYEIKATVHNPGDIEYYGEVYGILMTSGGNYLMSGLMLDIDGGATQEIVYTGTLSSKIPEGDHKFVFAVAGSNGYTPVSETVSMTIEAAPQNVSMSLGGVTYNAGTNKIAKNDLGVKTSLTCTSGAYYGTLDLVLFANVAGTSTWSYVDEFASQQMYIESGESGTAEYHNEFASGNVGQTYLVMFFHGSERFSYQNLVELINPQSSVEGPEAQTEPVAVEIFNLSGQRVTAKPVPGHYIMVKRAADGSTTSEHIIIR